MLAAQMFASAVAETQSLPADATATARAYTTNRAPAGRRLPP